MMKKFFAILVFSIILLGQAGFVSAAPWDACCNDGQCGTNEKCFCLPDSPDPNCGTKLDPGGSGRKVMDKGRGGVCHPKDAVVLCPLSTHGDIKDIVDAVTNYIFYIALAVAPLMILIGAFVFLTSGGVAEKATLGKKIIRWAIIGLAIVLFAKAIMSIVSYILGVK